MEKKLPVYLVFVHGPSDGFLDANVHTSFRSACMEWKDALDEESNDPDDSLVGVEVDLEQEEAYYRTRNGYECFIRKRQVLDLEAADAQEAQP